ncbi:hypothetical protein [Lewinella sp. LCG006]|uniref:hypothetical protein n=1 Tax=Lewinella sp. LCG006 TaxID=3231911 RepID=UPI00345F87EE
MNQKRHNTNKKQPKALSNEELKQVKGGYREMPGTINSSLSVRWDEIIIRMQDGKQIKGLLGSSPSNPSSSVSGGGLQDIMP